MRFLDDFLNFVKAIMANEPDMAQWRFDWKPDWPQVTAQKMTPSTVYNIIPDWFLNECQNYSNASWIMKKDYHFNRLHDEVFARRSWNLWYYLKENTTLHWTLSGSYECQWSPISHLFLYLYLAPTEINFSCIHSIFIYLFVILTENNNNLNFLNSFLRY